MRAISGLCLLASLMLPSAAFAQSPAVVELFESQGCSSCPPAIRNINALADQPDTLALIFSVTYWDRLGWKDTFAKPEFTTRQYDYARGQNRNGVYTPQVVINGGVDLVGTDPDKLAKAIAMSDRLAGPEIGVVNGTAFVAADRSPRPADVWLVRYDPRTINVDIGAGENSGVTIAHRNVVRDLLRLGKWRGAAQNYAIPGPAGAGLKSAILVQGENGGPILSAARF